MESFTLEMPALRLVGKSLLFFLLLLSTPKHALGIEPSSVWVHSATQSLSWLLDYAKYLSLQSLSESYGSSMHPSTPRTLSTNNDTTKDNVLHLTLEFAVWYPAFHGHNSVFDERNEFLALGILALLRDFLCEDMNTISVVSGSNYSESLCLHIGNVTEDLNMFATVNLTNRSSVGSDVLLTYGTAVVSDQKEGDVDWMFWEVTYQYVEIARSFWPTTRGNQNLTSSTLESELQSTIQDFLDQKIQEGSMDHRLQEYFGSKRPKLSVLGQEIETFQESAEAILEEYDFSAEARILRRIGIGMMIMVIWLVIILTSMARKRRLSREYEDQQIIRFRRPKEHSPERRDKE